MDRWIGQGGLSWLTKAQLRSAKQQMSRIVQKIAGSRDEKPAGQWTRRERSHIRLRSKFPTSPWSHAVAGGMKHSLKYMPPQYPVPPYPKNGNAAMVLQDCIESWLDTGVAVPITNLEWSQFQAKERHLRFLALFVVRKPGKTGYYEYEEGQVLTRWRPCLNGKPLNAALAFSYFKQSNCVELDCLSQRGDLSTKTDLHSAFQIFDYSLEPIDPERYGLTTSSDLMCFKAPDAFKKIAPHGFKVLVNTFGVSNAPLFLRQPYKLVLDDIRSEGLRLGNVCDDNLLCTSAKWAGGMLENQWRAASVLKCLCETELIVDKHLYYGLPLSSKDVWESITPTRMKEMNGFLMDHDNRAKYWPQKKVDSCLKHLADVAAAAVNQQPVQAKSMASLLGKLESAVQGLLGVHLFTDGLSSDLRKALRLSTMGKSPVSRKQAYNRELKLSRRTTSQLQYLLNDAFKSLSGRMMIHGRAVDYQVQTDWSSYGRGAHSTDKEGQVTTISMPLGQEWRQVWSGAGETWAAVQAIKALATAGNWRNGVIALLMDNIAACFYLNKLKSKSPEINVILLELVLFLKPRQLMVVASWIAGHLILADFYSRLRTSIWDGELSQELYLRLVQLHCKSRGILEPSLDLFATHLNRKTERFVSLQPNPGSAWVNAMSRQWRPLVPVKVHTLYAFPPPTLLLPVIQKAMEEKQTMLLLLPVVRNTPFQQLAEAAVTIPSVFSWTDETVINPQVDMMTLKDRPYLTGEWMLACVLISGNPSVRNALRSSSSKFYCNKYWDARRALLTECGSSTSFMPRLQGWIRSLKSALKRNDL